MPKTMPDFPSLQDGQTDAQSASTLAPAGIDDVAEVTPAPSDRWDSG